MTRPMGDATSRCWRWRLPGHSGEAIDSCLRGRGERGRQVPRVAVKDGLDLVWAGHDDGKPEQTRTRSPARRLLGPGGPATTT